MAEERNYTKAPAPNLNRAYKLLIGTATNTKEKRNKIRRIKKHHSTKNGVF